MSISHLSTFVGPSCRRTTTCRRDRVYNIAPVNPRRKKRKKQTMRDYLHEKAFLVRVTNERRDVGLAHVEPTDFQLQLRIRRFFVLHLKQPRTRNVYRTRWTFTQLTVSVAYHALPRRSVVATRSNPFPRPYVVAESLRWIVVRVPLLRVFPSVRVTIHYERS